MAKASTSPDPGSARRVRKIAVPPAARALSTLGRIDYEDAFLVDVGAVHERTAEEWAQAVVEDAPTSVRTGLQAGWSAIGLKLLQGPAEESVLGWEVRHRTTDFVLLAADSRIGMPGELLLKRERDDLLFCTFVQKNNDVARAMWAGVEPVHVRIVSRLLDQASRRCRP